MSFITSQQANIQGCKILTPHTARINEICGTSMCSNLNLRVIGAWTGKESCSLAITDKLSTVKICCEP